MEKFILIIVLCICFIYTVVVGFKAHVKHRKEIYELNDYLTEVILLKEDDGRQLSQFSNVNTKLELLRKSRDTTFAMYVVGDAILLGIIIALF